ncbi:MAG TPA: gluconokinase, partial [Gammaproteobacteria bacterium]|nr:gluconokinase [Gammaproteobacteria bacterium]
MRIDSSTPKGLPFILIVMGVSGSGKTTIGQWLSAKLGCSFLDADDFHPPGNVRKMAVGDALTDEDRWPWLEILAGKIREHIHNKQSMVMA